jgi:hypothetical protein
MAGTLVVNAECVGQKFFKERSTDFLPGISSLCFETSISEVASKIVPKDLVTELNVFKNFQNLSEQKIWVDSTHIGNWFNDGGECCFGNMYYKNYTANGDMSIIGTPPAYIWGVTTLFVGNQNHADTNVAFTFYVGRSSAFYRKTENNYQKTAPVKGLFEITIFVDDIQGKYFEHKLDSLGYGRWCGNKKYNCTTERGGKEFRTITWTNDKDVIIIFDPLNHKVHIRRTSIFTSLADAMYQNLQEVYKYKLKQKNDRLDE